MELTELKNKICESFSGDSVELQKILDLVEDDRSSLVELFSVLGHTSEYEEVC